MRQNITLHAWRAAGLFLLFASISINLNAQLNLAGVFDDDMLLQRNQLIHIWGQAAPGAEVHLQLHTQLTLAFADQSGKWEADLGALTAGGPYQLEVQSGGQTITFENILIGDLWICSGQSNMERLLKFTDTGYEEAEHANWPEIRMCNVSNAEATLPNENVPNTSWIVCNPDDVLNYSAVAYFFGRDLHINQDIPIGLIILSKGGTKIDSWISPDGLSVFEGMDTALAELQDQDMEELESNLQEAQLEWEEELENSDLGLQQNWQNNEVDWQLWPSTLLPKPWQTGIPMRHNGSLWLKKEFNLSSEQANQDIDLNLGRVHDNDQVYINGQLLPSSGHHYQIPAELVEVGNNVLSLRLHNAQLGDDILHRSNQMKLTQERWQVPLAGQWHYQTGTPDLGPPPSSLLLNAPSTLYNGMIHPFTPLNITGVIWYQGESDTGDPHFYRNKQVKLIDDWRANWERPDLPFLVVQLPIFRVQVGEPDESSWATLRESQTLTLKREHTALVCTIDSGEAFDIHPDNKFLVGSRLGRAARKLVYNENIVATGPSFFLAIPSASSIQIIFRTHGSSLSTNATNIPGFAIAGDDGQFIWANAELVNGQTVNVWHPDVPFPKHVRYAWSDNPGPLDLRNPEGLPALPFRTDELPTPWEN